MKKKNIPKTVDNNELRSKAMERLKQKKKDSKAQTAKEDLVSLVQELQVHQIELEIQNEELIRVNSENEELKNKYFELYDLAPSGYFTLDDKGKILELNLTAAKFFNKEKSLITGYNFINFIDPSDKKDFINFINEAFITRSKQTSVFKMKKGLQYFQIDGLPIEGPENKFNRLWMTVVDITNNILLEKELAKRESDARYHTLFNTMTEGFVLCELIYDDKGNTIDYRFLELNNSFERLLTGLISQKIIGRLASEAAPLNEIFDIKKYTNISPASGYVYFETHSKSLNKDYEVSAYCPESGKLAILFNDITERKKSEEKLRESEKRLSAVFNGVSETLMLADIEGNIIAANNLAVSRLNKGKPDIVGKNLYDLLPARFHEPRKEQLREMINTKMPVKFQDEFNDTFLELCFYPITDIKGDVIQFVSFAIDITERKKAEDALKESEERFRTIAEMTPVLVSITNSGDSTIIYTNTTYNETFGFSKEEIIGKKGMEVYYNPDDRKKMLEVIKEQGFVKNYPVKVKKNDGTSFWLLSSVSPIAFNNKPAIISASIDITERKKTEDALMESEERYRNLFNSLIEGFCIIEMVFDAKNKPVDYRFLEVNPAFETQTGLHDATGKLMRELEPEHEEHWFEIYGKIAMTGVPMHFENEAKALNCWYEVYAFRVGGDESRKVAICFNDITSRKKAEKAQEQLMAELKQRMLELDTVFEALPFLVSIHGPDGRYLRVNPVIVKLFGIDPTSATREEIAKHLKAHFPDGQPLTPENMPSSRTLRGETVTDVEYIITDKQGEEHTLLFNGLPLKIDENVYGAIFAQADITEHKKLEEKLKKTLQRFYNILSNMHFGILLVTADDHVEFANQAFCDIFGLKDSPADLLNITSAEMIEKIRPAYINPDAAVARIKEIVSLGQPVRGEDVGMHGERTFLRDFIPIRIGGNQYNRLWIHIDITERKRIEDALLESEQRLKFHFENSPLAIVEWDANFILIQWSSEAERIFGWKKEETIGKRIDLLKMIYDEDIPIVNHTMERLAAGKELVVVSSNRNITKSGTVIECVWYNSVLLDHNGQMSSIMSLVQDITEQKRAETELVNAKEAAENASKIKSQFIANVSHELRTPLNAVLGYAQILKKSEDLSEKQRNGIEVIYNSGNHLLNLINDILDISKLDAGKMNLKKISFNFPDFLKNISEIISVEALEKKLEFKLEIKSDMPVYIAGDETRLNQVLFNLLSNAVKFTDKGKVILRVQIVKADKKNIPINKNKLRFEIIDTGIGIPEDKLKVIFDSFQQLNIKQSKSKGTGLGLAISLNLVKLMESELYVKSKVGAGSTFWFDLEFEAFNEKYMPVDFKGSIKSPETAPDKDTFAIPSSDDLKTLFSLAKIGDIINIRKYIEKLEIENQKLIPFVSKLKLLAKNINLSEIEVFLKKYIKE